MHHATISLIIIIKMLIMLPLHLFATPEPADHNPIHTPIAPVHLNMLDVTDVATPAAQAPDQHNHLVPDAANHAQEDPLTPPQSPDPHMLQTPSPNTIAFNAPPMPFPHDDDDANHGQPNPIIIPFPAFVNWNDQAASPLLGQAAPAVAQPQHLSHMRKENMHGTQLTASLVQPLANDNMSHNDIVLAYLRHTFNFDNTMIDTYCCPLSLDLLDKPVMASDGKTYSYDCLKDWVDSAYPHPPCSAITREPLRLVFTYNENMQKQLNSLVDAINALQWRPLQDALSPQPSPHPSPSPKRKQSSGKENNPRQRSNTDDSGPRKLRRLSLR